MSEAVPLKKGQRWTGLEDNQLLDEIKKSIPVNEIASSHGRTERGITMRIETIAISMHRENEPLESIIEKTKIDKDKLNELLSKPILKEKPKPKLKENEKIEELELEIKNIKKQLIELAALFTELTVMVKPCLSKIKDQRS